MAGTRTKAVSREPFFKVELRRNLVFEFKIFKGHLKLPISHNLADTNQWEYPEG
jgi:hypothetical protein